jgi:hypothetical protein
MTSCFLNVRDSLNTSCAFYERHQSSRVVVIYQPCILSSVASGLKFAGLGSIETEKRLLTASLEARIGGLYLHIHCKGKVLLHYYLLSCGAFNTPRGKD